MGRWDGLNRRKFPRVNYPCLVVVKNDQPDDKTSILTHTENLGIGGIGIIVKENLRMFSPVDVELDLLDMREHIRCRGKIVWNVQRKNSEAAKPLFYDIGIEFEDLGEHERHRLETAVEKLAKKQ